MVAAWYSPPCRACSAVAHSRVCRNKFVGTLGRMEEPQDRSGSGGRPDPEDPFAQLLDPDFAAAAAVREPTAEERARQAEREARAADLQRRLAAEQEHERQLAERDRRHAKQAGAHNRRSRIIGPLVVLGLVGAGVYLLQRGTSSEDPAASSAATPSAAAARPEGYPPRAKNVSTKPLGTPPPLPTATGPFEFMQHQKGTTDPVAWDPCRPVRYVVNTSGAPAGTDALVQQAIANTAAATGLKFESAGTTTEAWAKDRDPYQPDRYGKQWAPALIAWGTEAQDPGLGGYIGGLSNGIPRYAEDGRAVYVSGSLVLDAQDLGATMGEPGGPERVQAIIQHELGHMVGLDHVADPKELMFTEGSPAQTANWGPGDLHGLHRLGTGDCFPDV
jgi:hypothetical protein